MGCRMSKRTGRKGKSAKNKNDETVTSVNVSEDMLDVSKLQEMKRPQLQKLCKQFGLKASGKNTELIKKLEEHVNQKGGELNNNNNTEEQLLSSSSCQGVEEPGKKLSNITFEITDSQIPTDEHVHVSSEDSNSSDSQIGGVALQANDMNDCVGPDSTVQARVPVEQTNSEVESSSRQVLKELNCKDTSAAALKANTTKAEVNTCTKWCVVEGLLKQENKAMWKKIHLCGGKAMISNSFGKRVAFVLEPCGLTTPEDYDDNYICSTCVRDNEAALRCKGGSRFVHSSMTPQEPDHNIELNTTCSTPRSSNHSFLTNFSRAGSVKRKRSADANSSVANSSADSDQMEKKRRKDPVIRSGGSTPASPQIRRARGEQLVLPRNLTRPWRPKKTTKAAQGIVKEDTDFAKRVEEIIKKTQPGSEEEMFMIMYSKSSKIQRSPTKSAEQ